MTAAHANTVLAATNKCLARSNKSRTEVPATKKCTEGPKMNQIAELRTEVVTCGKQLKFTPERIQQIKNLVERGNSRGEIADLVGVTVGSLQVTCSRLGISLRQPRSHPGTGPPRRNEPRSNRLSRPSPGRGDGSALLQLIKERSEQNSRSAPVD